MRRSYAEITLVPGKGAAKQYKVAQLESWNTEQSVDNDVDSFSVEVGDVKGTLLNALDRDTEVKVNIFCDDESGASKRVFTGLTDIDTLVTDKTQTMQGSDVPSAVLMASDALPGYWRHVTPKTLLSQRSRSLGLTRVQIAQMKQIPRLWSDASEKEWAFQYRVARMGGCFMWSDDLGTQIIDKLNYSPTSFSYSFGHPLSGESSSRWTQVIDFSGVSNKQQRVGNVIVYGEDKKKVGVVPAAYASNPSSADISRWLRRPNAITTLPKARTQKDLQTEADLEMYESVVGAQEYTITVGGGEFIQQNKMARVNLPEYGVVGHYYVVGVARSYSSDGLTQEVRLRERGYATETRVPDAPNLTSQPNTAGTTSTANIAQGLTGTRWANSFVRAARTYLSGPGTQGWDFSLALGVLLSICATESSFTNIRERSTSDSEFNGVEWSAMPTTGSDEKINAKSSYSGDPIFKGQTAAQRQQEWRKAFANAVKTPDNPWYPTREAGVGPMQATDISVKQFADSLGWDDGSTPQGGVEYAGGRWCPDSNIQAAARLLASDLREMGADPNNSGTVWLGVAAYNAGVAGAKAGGGLTYAAKVRSQYTSTYGPEASRAVTASQKTPTGSALRVYKDGNGNVVASLPDNAPDTVAKGSTWIWGQRGNAYKSGGAGPLYDCSSLCDEGLVIGDPNLKSVISAPSTNGGSHGDTTFTLKDKGTPINKDDLLPGDLVFFNGKESNGALVPWGHVGWYMGNGIFVADPHTGGVVSYYALGDDYWRENYLGARRYFSWPTDHSGQTDNSAPSSPARTTGKVKKVMIQAGHVIPAGRSDEPYGHSGETGATGEQAFALSVRDKVLALMSSDPRFDGVAGTAWDASPGASSSTSDDVYWSGDMFISIHYSTGTAGSGYLFGYTRGATDGRSAAMSTNSAKLADKIAAEVDKITGAPSRYTDNTHFGEESGDPSGASGWGYYAWGSSLRAAAENRVDYTPSVPVKVIFENGFESDAHYVSTQQPAIARAIYRGICAYYGLTPVGG